MAEANWYVAHTYSGYENKVKANIEKTIENRPQLKEEILEVRVPLQDVVEMKNGAKKVVQKKMFPGYVLINMVMNDDTWYVVRNTRGVTGFVGPQGRALPLSDDEVKRMRLEDTVENVDLAVGDQVNIVSGALAGFIGSIIELNLTAQKAKVKVEMFGRETEVELEFIDVEKVNTL